MMAHADVADKLGGPFEDVEVLHDDTQSSHAAWTSMDSKWQSISTGRAQ
jgi:hypothetical protein